MATLPDAGMPEDYSEEEFTQLLKQFETDKAQLTKNQKAAVARYNVKKGKGETIAWKQPGAAAAAPAAPAAGGAADIVSLLSPELQALAAKDPATLTKEERIALAKGKSQAVKAQAAAGGAATAEPEKPKGPTPEELARQKAATFPHVTKLRQRLGVAVKDTAMQTDIPYLVVDAKALPEVVKVARDEFGFTYISNLTAVDYPPDRMEVVYNFWNMTDKTFLAVKASVPRANPVAPTIAHLFAAADWQEREVFDMFGITFEGHPQMTRLLLPHTWVGYPLRKDYDVTKEQFVAMDERGEDVVSFREDEGW